VSRRWGALAGAALALIALAAVRGGGGGPPLYDGVCLPPHYLSFGASPAPPSASKTYSATDLAGTLEVADNDSTPQAQIIIGAGSLAVPSGIATATVSIAPVKPPAPKPSDGSIDGNVYSFTVAAGGHDLALAPGHPATVVLAATSSGGGQRVVEHFDGTRWSALGKTFQSGCGTTYEAASPNLGLFALVAQGATGSGSGAQAPGGGGPTVLIVIVVVVIVLVLVIVAARLARRRQRR
jgi:hypothetical protein